jgi:hypothetical protein
MLIEHGAAKLAAEAGQALSNHDKCCRSMTMQSAAIRAECISISAALRAQRSSTSSRSLTRDSNCFAQCGNFLVEQPFESTCNRNSTLV